MLAIVSWLKYQWNLTIKDNIHDEEVDSWLLMDNALPIVGIQALYLLFVLKIGPQMMNNRKPVSLRSVLLIFNLSLAIFNAYMFAMFYKITWCYLLSKIIELLDTVFFVIRKKQSQVTVLHVYHHSSMVMYVWLYVKYLKTEQGFIIGTLNTFVHVIMYMYYFLAAIDPKIQKYLWWKKYITIIQLMQFAIILTYLATLLFLDCQVHRAVSISFFLNTAFILAMFLHFYWKEYLMKRRESIKNCTKRSKSL